MSNDDTGGPQRRERRSVPGTGGPGSEETAPDGRRALRLHAGISAIGTALSIFVALLFLFMLDTPVLAIVFAVVAIGSAGWGLWAVRRLVRTRGLPR